MKSSAAQVSTSAEKANSTVTARTPEQQATPQTKKRVQITEAPMNYHEQFQRHMKDTASPNFTSPEQLLATLTSPPGLWNVTDNLAMFSGSLNNGIVTSVAPKENTVIREVSKTEISKDLDGLKSNTATTEVESNTRIMDTESSLKIKSSAPSDAAVHRDSILISILKEDNLGPAGSSGDKSVSRGDKRKASPAPTPGESVESETGLKVKRPRKRRQKKKPVQPELSSSEASVSSSSSVPTADASGSTGAKTPPCSKATSVSRVPVKTFPAGGTMPVGDMMAIPDDRALPPVKSSMVDSESNGSTAKNEPPPGAHARPQTGDVKKPYFHPRSITKGIGFVPVKRRAGANENSVSSPSPGTGSLAPNATTSAEASSSLDVLASVSASLWSGGLVSETADGKRAIPDASATTKAPKKRRERAKKEKKEKKKSTKVARGGKDSQGRQTEGTPSLVGGDESKTKKSFVAMIKNENAASGTDDVMVKFGDVLVRTGDAMMIVPNLGDVAPNFGGALATNGDVTPNFGKVASNYSGASTTNGDVTLNFGNVVPNVGNVVPNCSGVPATNGDIMVNYSNVTLGSVDVTVTPGDVTASRDEFKDFSIISNVELASITPLSAMEGCNTKKIENVKQPHKRKKNIAKRLPKNDEVAKASAFQIEKSKREVVCKKEQEPNLGLVSAGHSKEGIKKDTQGNSGASGDIRITDNKNIVFVSDGAVDNIMDVEKLEEDDNVFNECLISRKRQHSQRWNNARLKTEDTELDQAKSPVVSGRADLDTAAKIADQLTKQCDGVSKKAVKVKKKARNKENSEGKENSKVQILEAMVEPTFIEVAEVVIGCVKNEEEGIIVQDTLDNSVEMSEETKADEKPVEEKEPTPKTPKSKKRSKDVKKEKKVKEKCPQEEWSYFLQQGDCKTLPTMTHCRECRKDENESDLLLTGCCRFAMFRRCRKKQDKIEMAGFCCPDNAENEDLQPWIPSENVGNILSLETSKYILKNVGDEFCNLVKQEKEAQSWSIKKSRVAWKRAVRGTREMCDACATTIFNVHWVCPKCGFGVCLDCYKFKVYPSTLPGGVAKRAKDFRWFSCSPNSSHRPQRMVLAQIIPKQTLFDVGEELHKAREFWGIGENCPCKSTIKELESDALNENQPEAETTPAAEKKPETDGEMAEADGVSSVVEIQASEVKAEQSSNVEKCVEEIKEEVMDTLETVTESVEGVVVVVTHGEDVVVTHGEDVVAHGKDDVVTHGEDDVVTHVEDDVVTHGKDDVVTHREDDVVTHGEDDVVVTHGKCDAVTHGKCDAVTHGKDDVVTHGEDDEVTHGKDDVVTHGEDDEVTHVEDDVVTHGKDDVVTHGKYVVVTHGKDDVVTHRKDDVVIAEKPEEKESGDTVVSNGIGALSLLMVYDSPVSSPALSPVVAMETEDNSQKTPAEAALLARPSATIGESSCETSATIGESSCEPSATIDESSCEPSATNGESSCEPSATIGESSCEPSATIGESSCEPSATIGESSCEPSATIGESSCGPSATIGECSCEHPSSELETSGGLNEPRIADELTAPHSWICSRPMLRLHSAQHEDNLKAFQSRWEKGEPVLVSYVHKNMTRALWSPEGFAEEFGSEMADVVNCKTGGTVEKLEIGTFWRGFESVKDRLLDSKGEPTLLKLKDWPPEADFVEKLPTRFQDLNQALPLPEYTRRDGSRNLVARLPEFFAKPDLGPKMYNAYGNAAFPSAGTTNLHVDMSDAVNVMVYVGVPTDEQYDQQERRDALSCVDTACDDVQRTRARDADERLGALWHIFAAKDANKIRALFHKVAEEKNMKYPTNHDPIHDQCFYLDESLLKRLKDEYHVVGWPIAQCLGDAVFIPAGAPHQVRNLRSCVKVAEDFVSPEHVGHCFKLTQEFRHLSDKHTNHEDKLQVKNIIYHAVKDAISVLRQEKRELESIPEKTGNENA